MPPRRLKSAAKAGLKACLRRLPHNAAAPGARILTYHSVGRRDHEMNVTPAAFAEQMRWLADNGPVLTLAEAAEGRAGVALTFDDGYRDNLAEAAPVLKRHGFPAAVFMVAGRAGGVLPHDADDAPDAARLMTWDEVRALDAMGWTVGAHTLTHARLAELDEAGQRREIVGSAERIAQELSKPTAAFAYPYGSILDYNATSMALVQEAGCALACSNRYGPHRPGADRFQIRRIWIDATDTLPLFQAKVGGALDHLGILDAPWAARLRRRLNRALRA